MTSLASLAPVVASYADRMCAALGSEHHVASPLGAWLLLALAASAASGQARERLAEVLGADIDDARDAAAALLAEPHPAVSSAAGPLTFKKGHFDLQNGCP